MSNDTQTGAPNDAQDGALPDPNDIDAVVSMMLHGGAGVVAGHVCEWMSTHRTHTEWADAIAAEADAPGTFADALGVPDELRQRMNAAGALLSIHTGQPCNLWSIVILHAWRQLTPAEQTQLEAALIVSDAFKTQDGTK